MHIAHSLYFVTFQYLGKKQNSKADKWYIRFRVSNVWGNQNEIHIKQIFRIRYTRKYFHNGFIGFSHFYDPGDSYIFLIWHDEKIQFLFEILGSLFFTASFSVAYRHVSFWTKMCCLSIFNTIFNDYACESNAFRIIPWKGIPIFLLSGRLNIFENNI